MNYGTQNRGRYLPTKSESRAFGQSDYAAIKPYLPPIQSQPAILDIGCGSGNLLFWLREMGYQNCTGVEMSQALSQHGKEILGLEIHNTDWLGFLKSSSERFEIIVALDVVEHLRPEDCISALAAARVHLKPGGRIIIRTPSAECPLVLPTYHGDLTHKTLFSPDLLTHALREAEFLGQIKFWETRPHHLLKRLLFVFIHGFLVRPLLTLLFYHFYNRRPTILTRNMYCAADL